MAFETLKVSKEGGNNWGGLGREDGGNCAKGAGEMHGSKLGSKIAHDSGSDSSIKLLDRQGENGNTPVTGEKHNSSKGSKVPTDLDRL